jgi:hypothetical protein
MNEITGNPEMRNSGRYLAKVSEKFSSNDKLQNEIQRHIVLECGKQVDHKRVLTEVRKTWTCMLDGVQGTRKRLRLLP